MITASPSTFANWIVRTSGPFRNRPECPFSKNKAGFVQSGALLGQSGFLSSGHFPCSMSANFWSLGKLSACRNLPAYPFFRNILSVPVECSKSSPNRFGHFESCSARIAVDCSSGVRATIIARGSAGGQLLLRRQASLIAAACSAADRSCVPRQLPLPTRGLGRSLPLKLQTKG